MTPTPTLGQVLRSFQQSADRGKLRLSPQQWKTVNALAACRTGALGGQWFYCTSCKAQHFVAHSCRNRHCPQCQGLQALQWLERQQARLLPIPCFHLVFTLPHCLNGLIRQNRRALFNLLFAAASQTLLEFGEKRLKAQLGITAVLHTWSQTLLDHYHLHCVVGGGGLALDAKTWVKVSEHYLFPVRALGALFRGKFMAGLKALFDSGTLQFHGELSPLATASGFAALSREAAARPWVVYAKRPFAGPSQVLAYLSRYTHRVALSNRRLLAADPRSVTFGYKDYADGAKGKTMRLGLGEFVRRFCLHVLPERFVKIRHYGFLGNRNREQRLARARRLLNAPAPPGPEPGSATRPQDPPPARARCPFCHQPTLVLVREVWPGRALQALPILDSS